MSAHVTALLAQAHAGGAGLEGYYKDWVGHAPKSLEMKRTYSAKHNKEHPAPAQPAVGSTALQTFPVTIDNTTSNIRIFVPNK
jgi:hypothetical protein